MSVSFEKLVQHCLLRIRPVHCCLMSLYGCNADVMVHAQINGSLARAAIKELLEKDLIKVVSNHSKQSIYTRATAQ